mgnify:FL=1
MADACGVGLTLSNCAANVAAFAGGTLCDVRTQVMKDAGCAPCKVSMSAVVVTVTDALGTSVSKTVEIA